MENHNKDIPQDYLREVCLNWENDERVKT